MHDARLHQDPKQQRQSRLLNGSVVVLLQSVQEQYCRRCCFDEKWYSSHVCLHCGERPVLRLGRAIEAARSPYREVYITFISINFFHLQNYLFFNQLSLDILFLVHDAAPINWKYQELRPFHPLGSFLTPPSCYSCLSFTISFQILLVFLYLLILLY
jgi:hypothetical protein